MKNTHFELTTIVIKENKFPSEAGLDWVVPYSFIRLPPATIQSDDASIKRRSVVNECGAYSRGALFYIFALICGA